MDLSIELPYIKLPYDVSVKNFKCTRKHIEKEMSSVLHTIIQIKDNKKLKKQEAKETIKSLIVRLSSLKRKLNEDYVQQDEVYSMCKKRIIHLNDTSKDIPQQEGQYHLIRLRRMIVDFLLRQGQLETANQMIKIYELQPHCELEIQVLKERNEIIEDLQNHSIQKAMEWCKTNKSKLLKYDSDFQFKLFFQEYIQLLIKGEKSKLEIQQYLQQNSEIYREKHASEIQKASILLLVCKDNKKNNLINNKRYSQYFDNECWNQLITQFKHEIYNVFSVTSQNLLTISLNTGISCLKTLSCDNDKYKQKDRCPVCQDSVQEIAKQLPSSQRFVSSLICRISREVMDQHNPPAILPNGQVFSYNVLKQLADQSDDKLIKCPQTQQLFEFSQVKKIFLA